MKLKDTTKIAVVKACEFNGNSLDDRKFLIARGNDDKIYIQRTYGMSDTRPTLNRANNKDIQRLKEMNII